MIAARVFVNIFGLLVVSVSAGITTNPFINVDGFVSPSYAARIANATSTYPDSADLLKRALYPTGFWIDSINRISEAKTHLDAAAEAQKESTGRSTLVLMVLYNIPNRDCSAVDKNEIKCSDNNCANGITAYETQFIDPIVTLFQQYPSLTIVVLVEPDALANLVTQLSTAMCSQAQKAYKAGIAYAVKQLAPLANVAIYLDAGHSQWVGSSASISALVTLFSDVLTTAGGQNLIRGFATNTANFQQLGSLSSTANPCNSGEGSAIDESHLMSMLDTALVAKGITNKGYITDTSRNGATESRSACSNWCNVKGAGMGMRPTTDTSFTGLSSVDALVWTKMPGESDGTSDPQASNYDKHCGPTDAVGDAPPVGEWFPSYLLALAQNANPPLTEQSPFDPDYLRYSSAPVIAPSIFATVIVAFMLAFL